MESDALQQVAALFHLAHYAIGKWHVTIIIQRYQFLLGNAPLLHLLVGKMALQAQFVGVLHVVGLLIGLAIQIYHVVLNLQSLSGQSHTTLYIVLTTVGWTGSNLAKLLWVVGDNLLTCLIDIGVQLQSLLG